MVTRDPTWLNASAGSPSYDATDLRRVDALMAMTNGVGLGAQSGIRPGGGYTTTVAGSTISVSAGIAFLYVANQGMYRVAMTSSWSGTLTAAHATYDRIDLVYLRVWDDDVDASGLRQGDVVYLAGTASATPSAPTPAGTQLYMPLATITVPAAAGGGSASVSTSIRPVTVAPGGISPDHSQDGYYEGQYRDNGSTLQRYNGASWEDMQKVVTTGWTTASLATGYSHDGNSNGNVRYRKVTVEGETFMEWEGGLGLSYSSNTLPNSGVFVASALPSGYRPTSRRSLTAACSASNPNALSLKLDFNTDGLCNVVGTTSYGSDSYSTPVIRPPWVSLNGLRYRI